MTIEEAIRHCEEVAEQKDAESLIDRWSDGDEWSEQIQEDCRECAADHRQLAEWLTELKELRKENKVLTSECDRLIKEKGELLSKVSAYYVERLHETQRAIEVLEDWHKICEPDFYKYRVEFTIEHEKEKLEYYKIVIEFLSGTLKILEAVDNGLEPDDTIKTIAGNLQALCKIASFNNWHKEERK